MPQNPVKTELFTSQIIAGPGVTVSPAHGTGRVTVTASASNLQAGTGIALALGSADTTQISTLPATIVAAAVTLGAAGGGLISGLGITIQVGTGTTTQVSTVPTQVLVSGFASAIGTVTANGATPVTVSNTAVTASSFIGLTLKTAVGTVSPSLPSIHSITPGTGFTVSATASDTSVYNYFLIG